ncbi:MAG TPA: Gfo/Idh/MocA family oxidoreductase [Armatimonadetes bacterium]|nr:Gfo/Idh/MocA family oxidoreductase [Armatimonadota bacterium]
MKGTLKVGVIGVGAIGKRHVESYLACPQAEVVAIADVDETALREAVAKYDLKTAVTDHRELLALEEIAAVSVCTPPFAHASLTCDAAAAGKHVLCEKPMALNAREAREMVAACQKAGVKLGICHARSRFSPAVEAARRYVASGALGRVYYARVSRFRRRGRPGLDILLSSQWFLEAAKAGGGALADIGCYDLDLILYLLAHPRPVAVSAMTFRGVGEPVELETPYDVEEHAALFVRFEEGLTATFETAWAANMDGGDGVRLFGTKAGLRLTPLRVYTEQEGLQVEIVPQVPERQERGESLIADFVTACLTDGQPKTPGEEGLTVMEIMDAAYRSARLGREVTIAEVRKQRSQRKRRTER